MKKSLAITVFGASLVSISPEITKVFAETEVQSPQISKEDLILVATRAVKEKNYKLALRVASTAVKLYPAFTVNQRSKK